ncbi:MAG: hypothetical protein Q9208_007647 [Pyrenodesmia sp. 3 TL-2023]
MAAITIDANMYAIAESLPMESVPVKLRCATCNKLVVGAFRTPCCDQMICEFCQPTFPEACPICLHEPVKAEDCRPNRSLRTTVKAYLKKQVTLREQAQKKQAVKQAADQAAGAPAVVSAPTQADDPSSTIPNGLPAVPRDDAARTSGEASSIPRSMEHSKPSAEGEIVPTEAQKDVPQPSIEATEDRVREESFQEQDRGDATVSDQARQKHHGSQQPQDSQTLRPQPTVGGNGAGQGMNGTAFGFDGMANGFPSMAFANPADMNSMMQFMPNNAMNGFPNMMGMPVMPAMGMDPMQTMAQGMFGGLGGPGMGMSGMNAGMGFPAGQMWNGGFNGQSGPWMAGQDNFNQNGYGSHANGMGGDFGANAGYAGYNMSSHQGNYNQMNQQQFPNHDFQNGYHGQGFPNRGRGRGRYHPYAPRGRGGYNQVTNGNYANHEAFPNQPSQYPRRDSTYSQNPHQSQDEEKHQVDEFGRDISGITQVKEVTDEEIARAMAPGDADENESPEAPATSGTQEAPATSDSNEKLPKPSNEEPAPLQDSNEPGPNIAEQIKEPKEPKGPQGPQGLQEHDKPSPIQTFISDEPVRAEPTSPSSAITAKTMMPPPTPVIPQAPRSSSLSSEKSYEYNARGRPSGRDYSRGHSDLRGAGRGHGLQPAHPPVAAPIEPKGVGVEGAPKGPKAMREGLPNTGLRGGRGFSIVGRAASAAHGRPNGHVRSRSASPSRSRSRSPTRDHSHRHRSHRHRSPSPARESTDEERERRRERHERHKRRSRKHEESEEEKDGHTTPAHHSSHRSRRDRSADRDEDSNSHHRSHRSRRDRERDGEPRSTRKRSRTPPASTSEDINGVPPTELPSSTSSSRKRRDRERDIEDEDERAGRDRKRSRRDHAEEKNTTSRKEEDYEQARRDRKRSRREYVEEPSSATSHTQHDKHSTSSSSREQQQYSSSHKPTTSTSNSYIPKGPAASPSTSTTKPPEQTKRENPATDPHELERQARNKERMQKELQRREAMEGKAPTGPRGSSKHQNGGGASLGRRVSYKYEDDLDGNERVEREREAGRWG